MSEKQKLVKGQEPTLDLGGGFTAKLLHDFDRYQNGGMLMKLSDTHLTASDGETNIGKFGMAIGGALYAEIGGRTWTINPMQLFEAILKAEKEQYLDSK